ncbi:MAG: efflux RND transporter permease subunit [Verrucomicrobiae bacterium]|nr:efflux RND transporter permease subunit [Verrucomicrobiae bacterium]
MLDRLIRFCLEQKLIVALLVLFIFGWGMMVAPFDWRIPGLERRPVAVDAIPDLGENQQIVFTEWMGRSPQDVQDQITYPLTVSLLGVPGVKTIRSTSMFGFSSIYIIFDDNIDFYWARTRILEKLNSLPAGLLPAGVQPALGPDATAMGQVFWYTLEGRDPDGQPVGGWDLHELRSIQDWQVRFALQAADGIAEVASVGGFVREYQVDVDPDAMRAHGVTLEQVFEAVRKSNLDVGARTIEINRVEYLIRGLGFIRSLEDLELAVVRTEDFVPIRIKDVAHVSLGPALRTGALDKEGAEAVGGVVVVRHGFNPLEAIHNVKAQMARLNPALPSRPVIDWDKTTRADVERFAERAEIGARQDDSTRSSGRESAPISTTASGESSSGLTSAATGKGFINGRLDEDAWLQWLRSTPRERWPEWVTISQVNIVPFYDRTGLIQETLGTLNKALIEQALVTIIVVIVMVLHLRSSLLISGMLPLAVLMTFIAMKLFGVEANVVALAGIAIAIGTIVDMGIIVSENILKHLEEARLSVAGDGLSVDGPSDNPQPKTQSPKPVSTLDIVFRATSEVGSAILTAIATTVISFLPVFTMTGMEGKLFKSLAFTKTFVLVASVIAALTIIPAAAHVIIAGRVDRRGLKRVLLIGLLVLGFGLLVAAVWIKSVVVLLGGLFVVGAGAYYLFAENLPEMWRKAGPWAASAVAVLIVGWMLAERWLPLGPERGFTRNLIFVALIVGGALLFFRLFERGYGAILRWCLDHKAAFLAIPLVLVVVGLCSWLGFDRVFSFAPRTLAKVGIKEDWVRLSPPWVWAKHAFPGLGREFMPALDESSFLYMPSALPHASLGESLDYLSKQNLLIRAIPEVDEVVGKIGRVESALDPAPVGMVETVINYKPEFVSDEHGYPLRFKFDRKRGEHVRDEHGELIPDPRGRPYRQWREHIRTPDDIWNEIVKEAAIPGATGVSKLQPIETRRVMLQSGIRARMAVEVKGDNLDTINDLVLRVEQLLRSGEIPGVNLDSVIADRIVGKPYLEIHLDRHALARYGLRVNDVQEVIEVAIGGRTIITTVEGRERYPVRVRYQRELRGSIEDLERVLVSTMDGAQIPLSHLAEIRYVRGPEAIKGEDTFLVGYVLFDKLAVFPEVDVVEATDRYLRGKIDSGELAWPGGYTYSFAGDYENQLRAQRTLMIVLPLALFIIFMLLYFQFRSTVTTAIVFSGIAVAWAGGFTMIWLYGQDWFGNFSVLGVNLRELFQLHQINLSVAVWVGFLALFGIAVDDGVVIATYLRQSFAKRATETIAQIREATIAAGLRRVRPCLMTTGTTTLALLPVLTSTGRGADIMIPMAIPIFGGMTLVYLTMFTVPVLYALVEEWKLKERRSSHNHSAAEKI